MRVFVKVDSCLSLRTLLFNCRTSCLALVRLRTLSKKLELVFPMSSESQRFKFSFELVNDVCSPMSPMWSRAVEYTLSVF